MIVTFQSEEAVNTFMSSRPHRIDDQEVIAHRWAPNLQPLRGNYMNKRLLVSLPAATSLTAVQLKQYFRDYGEIDHIQRDDHEENTWLIEFDE